MTREDILRAAYQIECPWSRPEDSLPKITDVWPRICLRAMALLERYFSEYDFNEEDVQKLVDEAFATRRERWAAAARSVAEAQAKPAARKPSNDNRTANTLALLAALQGSLAVTPPPDSVEGATPDG
jgi:hypothetical protein